MFKQLPRLNEMWDDDDAGAWVPRENTPPWTEWFAWRPVCVKGKWTWLKKVYRRSTNTYVNHDDWQQYEYGTVFDVLKNEPIKHKGQVPPKPAPPAGPGYHDG